MKRLVAATLLLAACGPEGRTNSGVDGGGPGVDGSVTPDGTTTEASRVYAHSENGLYRLNALTLAASSIGVMAGLPGDLLDLAVDQNDRIVGITRDALFEIDSTTGAATLISDLATEAQGFTSLSFVPAANATDPDILVAARSDGAVFQFNEITGAATQIGSYGMIGSNAVGSSGDLFGVRGLGIFATVNIGTDSMANDYLALVDPSNGWKATPLAQSTGFNKVFGLGFWGGKIYGFVDDGFDASTGQVIQIDQATGVGTQLSSSSVRWFGAGVATDAPILQ